MKTPALFDLTGRVAIVTGGNGGIGRGIALGLAETGAAVAIFGRNEEKNRSVLAELKTIGVPSIAVKVDLTDRAALEPALNRVESELGDVSILVNNAVAVTGRSSYERVVLFPSLLLLLDPVIGTLKRSQSGAQEPDVFGMGHGNHALQRCG